MRYTHLTGSCRSGSDKAGKIVHAVVNGVALCGAKPRPRSDWSTYDDKLVTCEACLAKMLLPREFQDVQIGHAFSWGTINPIYTKVSESEAVRTAYPGDIGKIYIFSPRCKVNDDAD